MLLRLARSPALTTPFGRPSKIPVRLVTPNNPFGNADTVFLPHRGLFINFFFATQVFVFRGGGENAKRKGAGASHLLRAIPFTVMVRPALANNRPPGISTGANKRSFSLPCSLSLVTVVVVACVVIGALAVTEQAQHESTHPYIRRPWGSAEVLNGHRVVLSKTFNARDFFSLLRMTQATFEDLVEELSGLWEYQCMYDEHGQPRRGLRGHPRKTTMEQEVAIGLYTLSGLEQYKRIAMFWGIKGNRNVSLITHRFISALCSIKDTWIVWPNGDRVADVAAGFQEKSGLPGCIGAVDGCHIEILRPQKDSADYICYKQRYSMHLQATCDARGLFTHIACGYPGSMSDKRVFSLSGLPEKLRDTCLVVGAKAQFVVADAGYNHRPHTLVGWDHHAPEQDKIDANKVIDGARVAIENAFGRLKGRWRCDAAAAQANYSSPRAHCCFLCTPLLFLTRHSFAQAPHAAEL